MSRSGHATLTAKNGDWALVAEHHNLGPQPYQAASDQQWGLVSDNASRYWAMLGQHRADILIKTSPDNPNYFELTENTDSFDWCLTPDTHFELVVWYATKPDDDGSLSIYDSTTGQLTGH